MRYSTVDKKGQTTIPREIRKALDMRPGDRLEYEVAGEYVMVRVLPLIKNMSKEAIREAVAVIAAFEKTKR